MKNKIIKRVTDLIAILGAFLLLWTFISWLNVILFRPNIPKWNAFKVLLKVSAEEKQPTKPLLETSGIAFHEWQKGMATVVIEPKVKYTYEDYMTMARIIESESGADYLPDSTRYGVGSVVYNRLISDRFPNTIHEIAHQPNQYSPVGSAIWYREPSDRAKEIACDILENGGIFPPEVIWQANFRQGSGVYCYDNGIYFCY